LYMAVRSASCIGAGQQRWCWVGRCARCCTHPRNWGWAGAARNGVLRLCEAVEGKNGMAGGEPEDTRAQKAQKAAPSPPAQ
jgi:hypothetical protein